MSLAIERSRDQGDFRHVEADSTDLRPPHRMTANVRHLVHFPFTNWRCHEQRLGTHLERAPHLAGKQPARCGEERPVLRAVDRRLHLACLRASAGVCLRGRCSRCSRRPPGREPVGVLGHGGIRRGAVQGQQRRPGPCPTCPVEAPVPSARTLAPLSIRCCRVINCRSGVQGSWLRFAQVDTGT